MIRLPSNSEIEYFIELAQTLNMSRAAERLGVRQPTLSVALAKLEQTVGLALFTRTKKGIALTDAGQIFLTNSEELIRVWSDLKKQTREQGDAIRGQIRLGCHVSVSLYTLPLFLPKTLQEYPDLEFILEHDFSRKITESVISLKLDLGIVVNPVQHPDLVIKKLTRDEVTFWKSSALSKQQENTLIADHNLIQSQALMQKLKRGPRTFQKHLVTSSLEVARDLAVAGAGVAILPTRVATHSGKKLRKVPGLPTYQDEVCLVYRVERKHSKTIQMLSEKIQAVFAI